MLFKSKNIGREVFWGFVSVVAFMIIGLAIFDKDRLSLVDPIKIFSPSNDAPLEKTSADTEVASLQVDQKDMLEDLEMPDTSGAQEIYQDEIPAPIIVPTLDVVRIDPQGAALVAGSAEPFAELTGLVDNMVVFTTNAGADGKFVAIFDIPPSDHPRLLAVQSLGAAGDILVSADTIVIAPFSLPETEIAKLNTDAETDAEGNPPAAAPALIKITDSGVEQLTPVPGENLALALDMITYTDANKVVFSGKGTPNNTARLYLDDTFLGDAPIDENGLWSFESTKIKPELYMLRIDELGPKNTVIMRLATPFLRESQENLLSTILAETSGEVSAGETKISGKKGESAAEDSASGFEQTPQPSLSVITVQTGHTLWGISHAHYGDGTLFIQIFEANSDKIRDPDLIYPGQIFTLPN